MRTPVQDYLREVTDSLVGIHDGEVADYIPALATADPDVLALALTTITGRTYSVGDADREFSLQSISKPFAYAVALLDHGFEAVDRVVGVEPSGEAFDELSLEKGSHRPRNPMINAGALAVHSLLDPDNGGRVERLLDVFSALAGRPLRVDAEVHVSEMATADRNLALAHMLRSYGLVTADVHDVVDGYVQQCAVMVTARDVAVMGATLAGGGVQPVTGERVLPARVARQTLSVMLAAGMYNGAGSWITGVGIPAKSGVSGGLLGALPGQAGVCVFSPRLDAHGSSVRGVLAFQRLSSDLGLHLMDAERLGETVLRERREDGDEVVYALQGVVEFTGAEHLLHELAQEEGWTCVVLDLTHVDRVTRVGRRMVLEGLRRLRLDGRRVAVVDAGRVLPDADPGDGEVVEDRAQL
ncbi:glutaminase [uncultured Pseudokineococcus sp.]|uniref:glutaminase n=1 Tax=uncultured Pseudokineococcus sp. TaxID=1642928 RepID=UPI00262B79DB|nr:glutaminase [uncultured Pseudokineococcus sp.]